MHCGCQEFVPGQHTVNEQFCCNNIFIGRMVEFQGIFPKVRGNKYDEIRMSYCNASFFFVFLNTADAKIATDIFEIFYRNIESPCVKNNGI